MIARVGAEVTRVLGCESTPIYHEPATADEIAAILADARAARRAVVPWGGGTDQQLGVPPRKIDIVLRTGALSGVLAYTPEDLTLSVRAGMTLALIGRLLAERGQMLPLDVGDPARATVGGVVATAPPTVRRLKYGGVRDQVIGLEFALPDGTLCKAGGRVVKNVAGYDVCKLLTGSLGTLAVITLVHLKVQPAPREQRLIRATFGQPAAALGVGAVLAASGLGFGALVMTRDGRDAPCTMTVVLEGFAGAVRAQERAARAAIAQAGGEIAADDTDAGVAMAALAAWRSAAEPEDAVLLRGAVAPGRLEEALATLAASLPFPDLALQADVGTGAFWARIGGSVPVPRMTADIVALRARLWELRGRLIIAAAPLAVRAACDPWDAPVDGAGLARALKAAFDPDGVLNPGRFAYGI